MDNDFVPPGPEEVEFEGGGEAMLPSNFDTVEAAVMFATPVSLNAIRRTYNTVEPVQVQAASELWADYGLPAAERIIMDSWSESLQCTPRELISPVYAMDNRATTVSKEFTLVHIPGVLNCEADYLSRAYGDNHE